MLMLAGCGGGSSSSAPPPPPPNRVPVADAGSDISQSIQPSPVTLDGSGSSDPDDDALTCSWEVREQPQGADTQLENASGGQASFLAPVPGEYVFGLEVSDPDGLSSSDSVTVTLTNEPPVAEVKALERSAIAGAGVTLDASGSSDPDGHELQFTWRVVESPAESALQASYDGPVNTVRFDRQGRYVFELEVDDGFTRHQSRARLHPSGAKIYSANTDVSPSDIERYSIVDGALQSGYDSPYHGQYDFCGNVWYDPEGRFILSPCGVVVQATDDRATDMRYVTQLEGVSETILHASSSAFENLWYVALYGTEGGSDRIHTFRVQGGQAVESFDLPLTDAEGERRWLAKFVFASADTGAHYAIARADPGADDPAGSQRQALLVRQAPEETATPGSG